MNLPRLCALGLSVFIGCSPHEESAQPYAEVGVFFGGQMQHVKLVEVPPVRAPNVGFRVHFPPGVPAELLAQEITYEVVRPGPEGRRVTKKGTLKLPPGERRLDQVLSLAEPRKLGLWNVRVLQGTTLLADRALYLVASQPVTP